MMLSKKQNQSSKSFAQSYQRQRADYKSNANEVGSAGLMPTEQNETSSN